MKIYTEPERNLWSELTQRPAFDWLSLQEKVKSVLSDVKTNGDAAIKKYTQQFDEVSLNSFEVTQDEFASAEKNISADLKNAIQSAAKNIRIFHEKQVQKVEITETTSGVKCWRKSVPVEKIGLYIPGGSAPLFSTVLMLAIPAQIAGCKEVVLCSPPKNNGELNDAILYAAQITGVTKIYKIGGAQAIAAMAYGTESIGQVYKILGPGNQYVTCAKQLIQLDGIAIDMPAGPSEVCVLADETANVSFVAADLMSQAEHGTDSQVILICTKLQIANNVIEEIQKQIKSLPRKDIVQKVLENSKIFILADINTSVDLINLYAPEHLIICCENDEKIADKIVNAGSVFLGNYSPESVGDYASGTNHTLPTNGFAKAYSGVSVDSFVKKITFQKLSAEGLKNIAAIVETMAEAEGLRAHANAVRVRR